MAVGFVVKKQRDGNYILITSLELLFGFITPLPLFAQV